MTLVKHIYRHPDGRTAVLTVVEAAEKRYEEFELLSEYIEREVSKGNRVEESHARGKDPGLPLG